VASLPTTCSGGRPVHCLILRIDRKDAVVDGFARRVAHHFVQRHPLRHVAKEGAQ
jgi:hypothetical protein